MAVTQSLSRGLDPDRDRKAIDRQRAKLAVLKTCPICGAEFRTKHGKRGAKTCSPRCSQELRVKGRVYRKNRDAGRVFTSLAGNEVYANSRGYLEVYYHDLSADDQELTGSMRVKTSSGGLSSHLLEHRYVAAKTVCRPLTKDDVVHHINGDRHDNRPGNLLVVDRKEHIRDHVKERLHIRQLKARIRDLEAELAKHRQTVI